MKLMIYPTPLDALCQLQHDSGWLVDGVDDTDANGRKGKSFTIPDTTPDNWGCRLVISAEKKVSFMNRGLLVKVDQVKWLFFLDDITLSDVVYVQVPVPEPPNPNPDPIVTSPLGIINALYATGKYNLGSEEGCGKFTEDVTTACHERNSQYWGHIRKTGAQNQYNGHAVDAMQLLFDSKDTKAGVYDIVFDSGSPDARPQFISKGDPIPSLWYYPAASQL